MGKQDVVNVVPPGQLEGCAGCDSLEESILNPENPASVLIACKHLKGGIGFKFVRPVPVGTDHEACPRLQNSVARRKAEAVERIFTTAPVNSSAMSA